MGTSLNWPFVQDPGSKPGVAIMTLSLYFCYLEFSKNNICVYAGLCNYRSCVLGVNNVDEDTLTWTQYFAIIAYCLDLRVPFAAEVALSLGLLPLSWSYPGSVLSVQEDCAWAVAKEIDTFDTSLMASFLRHIAQGNVFARHIYTLSKVRRFLHCSKYESAPTSTDGIRGLTASSEEQESPNVEAISRLKEVVQASHTILRRSLFANMEQQATLSKANHLCRGVTNTLVNNRFWYLRWAKANRCWQRLWNKLKGISPWV